MIMRLKISIRRTPQAKFTSSVLTFKICTKPVEEDCRQDQCGRGRAVFCYSCSASFVGVYKKAKAPSSPHPPTALRNSRSCFASATVQRFKITTLCFISTKCVLTAMDRSFLYPILWSIASSSFQFSTDVNNYQIEYLFLFQQFDIIHFIYKTIISKIMFDRNVEVK